MVGPVGVGAGAGAGEGVPPPPQDASARLSPDAVKTAAFQIKFFMKALSICTKAGIPFLTVRQEPFADLWRMTVQCYTLKG
jgi:hypothetical protein